MFLGRVDRAKNKKVTDWAHYHQQYIDQWNDKKSHVDIDQQLWDYGNFNDYVVWLHKATRVHLVPRWTDVDCLQESSEETDEHDEDIRLGKLVDHGPVRNRVVSISYYC